jgi:hypothetical protein
MSKSRFDLNETDFDWLLEAGMVEQAENNYDLLILQDEYNFFNKKELNRLINEG